MEEKGVVVYRRGGGGVGKEGQGGEGFGAGAGRMEWKVGQGEDGVGRGGGKDEKKDRMGKGLEKVQQVVKGDSEGQGGDGIEEVQYCTCSVKLKTSN